MRPRIIFPPILRFPEVGKSLHIPTRPSACRSTLIRFSGDGYQGAHILPGHRGGRGGGADTRGAAGGGVLSVGRGGLRPVAAGCAALARQAGGDAGLSGRGAAGGRRQRCGTGAMAAGRRIGRPAPERRRAAGVARGRAARR